MSNANRHNDGKVQLSLIPWDAEEEEAKVWMAGAIKYGRGNWEKLWGENTVNTVLDSIRRHTLAIQRGESHDPETGLQHAAHIRCNAAMLIRWFNQIASDAEVEDAVTITETCYNVFSDLPGTNNYYWGKFDSLDSIAESGLLDSGGKNLRVEWVVYKPNTVFNCDEDATNPDNFLKKVRITDHILQATKQKWLDESQEESK